MTILVDIDDTISNMGALLLPNLNQIYGTSYTYDDINSWDWYTKTFKDPWIPTRETTFWRHITINPIAIQTIEDLVRMGNKVYLCSASWFDKCLATKINYTLSHFNPELINVNNVIVCQHKRMVNADVRIDDNPDNFSIHSVNLLVDQPWNRATNVKWCKRCADWTEIRRRLMDICSANKYE